jgi:hypothetical protein
MKGCNTEYTRTDNACGFAYTCHLQDGRAIFNSGTMTVITQSSFTNLQGGAIANVGSLNRVVQNTFENVATADSGAALYNAGVLLREGSALDDVIFSGVLVASCF